MTDEIDDEEDEYERSLLADLMRNHMVSTHSQLYTLIDEWREAHTQETRTPAPVNYLPQARAAELEELDRAGREQSEREHTALQLDLYNATSNTRREVPRVSLPSSTDRQGLQAAAQVMAQAVLQAPDMAEIHIEQDVASMAIVAHMSISLPLDFVHQQLHDPDNATLIIKGIEEWKNRNAGYEKAFHKLIALLDMETLAPSIRNVDPDFANVLERLRDKPASVAEALEDYETARRDSDTVKTGRRTIRLPNRRKSDKKSNE